MAEGISVRLTSVPSSGPAIRVPDIKDASDFASYAERGPLLVPVPGSVEVEYTSRVSTSLEGGGIRDLVQAGLITVEFVLSPAFLLAVGGGGGGALDYVADEVPAGAINGVNTSYTTSYPPLTFIGLYLNGQKLVRGGGNDYLISGTSITMSIAPLTGESLRADYVKTITGFTFVADEAPTGIVDGFNAAYTLANVPATFIGLYLNGLKQIGGGVDYTRAGANINMLVPPVPGDVLAADYVY